MHEFTKHLFYLLQSGLVLLIPAVLICAVVLVMMRKYVCTKSKFS